MSGEPTQDDGDVSAIDPPGADASGVIPVEVEAPDKPAEKPAEMSAVKPEDLPEDKPVIKLRAKTEEGTAPGPGAGASGDGHATGSVTTAAAEPAVPESPTALLEKQLQAVEGNLAAAEKEKKENWERYLRAAADLENMRKRVKREVEDSKFDMKHKVLKEMLPVLDNLERAIEHTSTQGEIDPALRPIVEGVQLVVRQFMTAFERLEVKPLEAMGQPFDPNLHEAISQQESEQPPGTVTQVLQRGYRAGERLLRPALVVVAKPKAAAE